MFILIDFRTGKQKDHTSSPIGRIGWIAFSPDGHWFGAVADSGDVLVWDSATGEAAAPPRRLDVRPQTFHRDQLLLDASTRTVLASSDMEMALWHLPGRHTPPVRLSGEFPNIAAFWLRVFAYDAQRGLIATDGGMNQLRLWRAPTLAQTGLHASPMPAPQLRIGDGSVVAVDRNRVSVVNLSSGKTGTSLELPLQPSFADLTDDRASLIAVTGPTLSIYDSTSGALRRSPIALPNSPARVLPSPDSRHVFLTFADYAGGSNREPWANVGSRQRLGDVSAACRRRRGGCAFQRGWKDTPSLARRSSAGVRYACVAAQVACGIDTRRTAASKRSCADRRGREFDYRRDVLARRCGSLRAEHVVRRGASSGASIPAPARSSNTSS